MDFIKKLKRTSQASNSLLCIGLDPDASKIPAKFKNKKLPIFAFNKNIIDSVSSYACAFKPNIAFYEANGLEGIKQLEKTINYIKKSYPQIPVILDAKRADIPNTASMYAQAVFKALDVDAVTAYPYLGKDSVKPFLDYKNKFTFLLIKTSNPDSSTFQNIKTVKGAYYLALANEIKKWKEKNFGVFCGATYPAELKNLRKIFPGRIFLSAGIGKQKADIKEAVNAGVDKNNGGILFNASRSIIYDQNPQKAARKLRDEINRYR